MNWQQPPHNTTMKTFTTIGAVQAMKFDRTSPERGLVEIENESKTITLQIHEDELQDYYLATDDVIEEDIISDEQMQELCRWCEYEDIFSEE